MLRGETDPLQLLFPGGSLAEMEQLYQSSPPARTFNQLLAESLRSAVEAWPGERPLRVLEVGAGTGSTTAFVLPMLGGTDFEYVFTDVSPLFLNRAREKFADVSGVSYATLDISVDPATQGFAPGHFDVIIGANVMHATPDLLVTMSTVRKLLAPGGLTVLLEGTAPQRFGDLTVGLLEGWWSFTDTERRQYALMPRAEWATLLRDAGFATSSLIVDDDAGPVLEEQAIFVAQAPAAAPATAPHHWLVVPDANGVAAELSVALRRAGDTVTTLSVAGTPALTATLDAAARAGTPFAGVLDLRALDVVLDDDTPVETLWTQQETLLSNALSTVQTLAASVVAAPLWFITRGAQATGEGEAANAAQATLWGFSHVVAIEHPELRCRRVDLDPAPDATASVTALIETLHAASQEDQIAVRGDRRLLRRLARQAAVPAAAFTVSPERTYLVTGGLRGLGPRVAEWLVDHGARSLALVGRHAPGADAEAILAGLRARGATVIAMLGDVSEESDVRDILGRIEATMPPLAGVLHSAGSLDDGVITAQNWPRFASVMKAKVRGSWLLHRLAGPLDFMVYFSSGASVAGSPGQANHAAANAFEDALAWYRQAQGHPTVSINWGPWAEFGAAAERTVAASSFLRPISPRDAFAALDACMRSGDTGLRHTQVAVLDADWSQIRQGAIPMLQAPLFRQLATVAPEQATKQRTATGTAATVSLREKIHATAANRRRSVLTDEIRRMTVQVLGIQHAAGLDINEPLRQLGLDSLMAVELRNLLGKAVGRTLPATVTFDHPTVSALVEFLGREVFAEDFHVAPVSATAVAAPVLHEVQVTSAAELDDMSDDDIALRLAQRLADLGTEDMP